MQYIVVFFLKLFVTSMMDVIGGLRKMEVSPGKQVGYKLVLGESKVELNHLIGQSLRLEYIGKIHCIKCGRQTNKSFAQGYCYPCFTTAPETEECVLRPELCKAHEGYARDMEYAEKHCLSEQVVYLSYTSGLKVGVTRNSQVPARWIDQGAIMALELARTPNRYLAGQMEVSLKAHVADKTNWRRMLSEVDPGDIDLQLEKSKLAALVPDALSEFVTAGNELQGFTYPVIQYPEKVRSLNFDKDPIVEGLLTGIKGQYLMFSDNTVINIRKFGGYQVRLKLPSQGH